MRRRQGGGISDKRISLRLVASRYFDVELGIVSVRAEPNLTLKVRVDYSLRDVKTNPQA